MVLGRVSMRRAAVVIVLVVTALVLAVTTEAVSRSCSEDCSQRCADAKNPYVCYIQCIRSSCPPSTAEPQTRPPDAMRRLNSLRYVILMMIRRR
ncbi:hypothetical protein CRG98_007807 [Punica granatum]|uniref:Uncharacterized protein n=1 Tax=Punica granatum TaxID=22663 RepID=A0A2I0KTK8_PUNGR|nr:hypothetical protein CRG98_007807 [Punica granatum]